MDIMVILIAAPAAITALLFYMSQNILISKKSKWWTGVMVVIGYLVPFFLIILFSDVLKPDYKYGLGKTYWSLIDVGYAGYAIIPLFIVGVIRILYAIFSGRLRIVDILIQSTFSLTAFWLGIYYIEKTSLFGGIAILYGLFHLFITKEIWVIVREQQRNQRDILSIVAWILGLSATYIWKVYEAKKLFNELPETPPSGCFIVTAAGKGHQNFVGSFFSPAHNKVMTRQLIIFYQFEFYLMERFPRFHKGLRKVYNIIGPKIAKRIHTKWIADMVYLLLKPLEFFILLILICRK